MNIEAIFHGFKIILSAEVILSPTKIWAMSESHTPSSTYLITSQCREKSPKTSR